MGRNIKNGFTLIELASVLALAATMTAMIGPSAVRMRSQMRGATSESNLSAIGQGGAMYGTDNADRISTYNWRAGEVYINLANGGGFIPSNDQLAASYQIRDILYRATGRLNGSGRILTPFGILVHRRYSHLVLADYMGNVGDSIWAHPDDYNQQLWQQFPQHFSFVPHGQGSIPTGYTSAPGGGETSVKQLWAFGSSYQTVPHAWMPDTAPTFAPISNSPYLTMTVGGNPHVGDRLHSEVAFPSNKVWMFGEYDHDQVGNPYFAYDHAAPAKLMFDGSINTMESGQAQSSVSPADYSFGSTDVWTQRYLPMDTFPVPLGGLGDQTELDMRYRWTLRGLKGVDYIQLGNRVRPR